MIDQNFRPPKTLLTRDYNKKNRCVACKNEFRKPKVSTVTGDVEKTLESHRLSDSPFTLSHETGLHTLKRHRQSLFRRFHSCHQSPRLRIKWVVGACLMLFTIMIRLVYIEGKYFGRARRVQKIMMHAKGIML